MDHGSTGKWTQGLLSVKQMCQLLHLGTPAGSKGSLASSLLLLLEGVSGNKLIAKHPKSVPARIMWGSLILQWSIISGPQKVIASKEKEDFDSCNRYITLRNSWNNPIFSQLFAIDKLGSNELGFYKNYKHMWTHLSYLAEKEQVKNTKKKKKIPELLHGLGLKVFVGWDPWCSCIYDQIIHLLKI